MTVEPHYKTNGVAIYVGNCIEVMRALPADLVDAVVTDPPYGLEFMGKEWDAPWRTSDTGRGARVAIERAAEMTPAGAGHSTSAGPYLAARVDSTRVAGKPFQAWCEEWAVECLRVLKPGGHLLAFGGTRTSHRLTCAIEDAGFEIRDTITWLYGSGFPKSLDVSKAIDKAAGATREVIGNKLDRPGYHLHGHNSGTGALGHGLSSTTPETRAAAAALTAPATPEAQQWQGWGTALKPASEPIVVARKPLVGTVAGNVMRHGAGALNIDACRTAAADQLVRPPIYRDDNSVLGRGLGVGVQSEPAGRWPPNVVLTHAVDCGPKDEPRPCAEGCPVAKLDRQSGRLTSGKMQPTLTTAGVKGRPTAYGADAAGGFTTMETYGDSGGASRFFPTFRYQAKAPAKERPKVDGVAHPTVKPLELMRWLVRLVTPPGGTVLDPFAGSGATVEACMKEGFKIIGIERDETYIPLVMQRIERT